MSWEDEDDDEEVVSKERRKMRELDGLSSDWDEHWPGDDD